MGRLILGPEKERKRDSPVKKRSWGRLEKVKDLPDEVSVLAELKRLGPLSWDEEQALEEELSAKWGFKQAQIILAAYREGRPLPTKWRQRLEAGLKENFSKVTLHEGPETAKLLRNRGAKALAAGETILMGQETTGSFKKEKTLAHEIVHVVQQRKSGRKIQGFTAGGRQPAAEKEAQRLANVLVSGPVGPLTVRERAEGPQGLEEEPTSSAQIPSLELKGRGEFSPPQDVIQKIIEAGREGIEVPMHYGGLARGRVRVQQIRTRQERPLFQTPEDQPLLLVKPLLPEIPLALFVRMRRNQIQGYLGIPQARHYQRLTRISRRLLRKYPKLFGLPGLDLLREVKVENKLQDGQLSFALRNVRFRLLKSFRGSLSLALADEKMVLSDASAHLDILGLAQTDLQFERGEDGFLKGQVETDIELGSAADGKVTIEWDKKGMSGGGEVSYQNEKFSGTIQVEVFTKDRAQEILESKGLRPRRFQKDFGVLAEGDLNFSFTDWLSGTAHVIIDPWGHLTVIGEITPQKEIELFPQKNYVKELPELEARASYGLPVVGNIFLFVSIGLELWAIMGPGKFYNIQVSGTYSTDPEVAKNFEIQGSLNISAGAGIDLRAKGGAGLEILDHDIKAGVGLTGRAGIKGYAEATPIIGYREQEADRKGKFFIRGELEIAAQPFLGLGGDVFIKVDSPWWSPLPDKTWKWPLFNKEWPLPGQFGIKAQVEYVFGSKQWPTVEFGRVDFDPAKFMSDIMAGRTKRGKGGEKKAEGKWREKNQQAARPPEPKEKKPSGFKEGRPRRPDPKSLSRKVRAKTLRKRPPYRRRGRRPPVGVSKTPRAVSPKGTQEEKPDRRQEAFEALKEALAKEERPIKRKRLKRLLKELKRRYGFRRLEVRYHQKEAYIYAQINPNQEIGPIPVEPFEVEGTVKIGKRPVRYRYSKGKLIYRTLLLPKAKYDHPYIRMKYKNCSVDVDLSKSQEEREDQQRKIWCQEVSPSRLEERIVRLEEKGKKVGKEPSEARAEALSIVTRGFHKIPIWSRSGEIFDKPGQNFDVDHLIELQLGGEDKLSNYILLHYSANRSSGAVFKNYLAALRRKKETIEQELKKEDETAEIKKICLQKESGEEPQRGGGRVGRKPIWTKAEIIFGRHLDILLENPSLYQKVKETKVKTCPP